MKVLIGGPFEVTAPMMTNVYRVITSGRLSPGPFVKTFESAFARYHGVSNAIMTNSGTSALVVALQALKEIEGWPDGAEVIVPAITFVATVNAVLQSRLTPVLVDVNATDYTIDIERLEATGSGKTKAIIPVHAFGLPADMGTIRDIADDYDLRIIEDACEALGATVGDVPVGCLGDIGCFSFYMSHHITAGVGGMAVTDDPHYAHKIRSLINHGWERESAPMDVVEFDFEEMRKRYYFTSVGHSFRATELEAAIALPQLATLEGNIKQRRGNAKVLREGLANIPQLQLPQGRYKIESNRRHAFMMYPIILRRGDKWDLMRHLEEAGIQTREMLPLTNQPVYAGLFDENDYPVARWINRQGFYVGCSQYLNEEHMNYVAEKIGDYFD